MTTEAQANKHKHPENTILTMQLGTGLLILLSLMFISGGLFYLYVFNASIGPYFTATRAIHFYAGLASIPFLLAKYGSTTFRFAGYYLRVPRFKERGPPKLVPRLTSPLLAADFFVLYFSGLYMLFHYYYRVTNIPPFEFKPVQVHLWAAILAVPLIAIHLGSHLIETIGGLAQERRALRNTETPEPQPMTAMTRRAFVGTVLAGGAGLAIGFQNTPLAHSREAGFFIGTIPKEERGGSGNFPVETLFGKRDIDVANWQLKIGGHVDKEVALTYDDLLKLPATTGTIRLSCVSGWTNEPVWSGPRVRDVLALASTRSGVRSVNFHSVSNYSFTWHLEPLMGDKALLATHVNGAPLSNNHGYPVRLIVPGYPGQNMVKQLDQIMVNAGDESFNPDFKVI